MRTAMFAVVSAALVVVAQAEAQPGGAKPPPAPTTKKAAQAAIDGSKALAPDLEQLRLQLRSPDAAIRAATMAAMVESGNVALAETAITEAFVSTDPTMRNLAFRAAFRSLNEISIEPVVPAGQAMTENLAYHIRYGLFRMTLLSYDWNTGMFFGKEDSSDIRRGSISGSVMTYRHRWCNAQLENVRDTWEFRGTIFCSYNQDDTISMPVRFILR